MLSYRHGFHAGNFADVLKHAVLVETLDYLKQKDKPLLILDTHAGAGFYDLHHEYAQKTREFGGGIESVLVEAQVPEALHHYVQLVQSANPNGDLRFYPGSPWFSQQLMGRQDRLVLAEMHPSEISTLNRRFQGERRIKVVADDGWKTLIAHVPPIERRGLIIIDPSYELKDDYRLLVTQVTEAIKRFATGTYLIWYPMIERAATEHFLGKLAATGIPRQLRLELSVAADRSGHGMTGAGMVVINPPWTLESRFRDALPWLAQTLGHPGDWRLEWLVGEGSEQNNISAQQTTPKRKHT